MKKGVVKELPNTTQNKEVRESINFDGLGTIIEPKSFKNRSLNFNSESKKSKLVEIMDKYEAETPLIGML